MGSLSRTSGVGFLDNPAVAMPPVVHRDIYSMYPSSARPSPDVGSAFPAPVAAPIGHPPPTLASSGGDQLRVPGSGPLDSASSSLSPNSLLFPLPPSSLGVSSSLPDPTPSTSGLVTSASPPPDPLSSPLLLFPLFFLRLFLRSLFLRSLFLSFCFLSLFFFFNLCSSSCVIALSSFSFFSSFLRGSHSSSLPPFVPPPPGFPLTSSLSSHSLLPSASLSSSSSFLPSLLSSSTFPFPPGPPPPPLSSSSFSGSLPSPALADHQAQLLGLSHAYQSVARWFVSSGGTDFAGIVRSSFPHLLPDLARDFSSGNSLFLATLRSSAYPSQLTPPLSFAALAAPPPPLSAHLPASSVAWVPPPSSSMSSHSVPVSSSSSMPPPPGFLPPSFTTSSSFFPASLASSSGSLSAPAPPVHPPFPVMGSAVVHGLGVGVPSSSGVPPFPPYSSAATASAAWPPTAAYSYDHHASAAPPPHADPLDDADERFPENEHIPLDPSAPPLSLDSAWSEYRRMVEYFKNTVNLFIHIARIPIGDSPRVHPNILKCPLQSPVAKGYRLVVIASRAIVCKTPTYYLILESLAYARGCVILRSHILILLLLILLIFHHIHS